MGSASTSEPLGSALDRPLRKAALRLVASSALRDVCTELARARFVVARACPEGAWRGRLASVLDDAVEGALVLKGALPPAVAVGSDIATSIADQLLRVRALDARGLALVLPLLDEGADPCGTLHAADSAVLRAWLAAAREATIEILADERDGHISILMPRSLGELADAGTAPIAGVAAPPVSEAQTTPAAAVPVGDPKGSPEPRSAALEPPPVPAIAERVVMAAEWRALAVDLDAARGPKPIAVVEKLFATRYAPLVEAVAAGEVDAAVREVVDDFRTSFAHSYKDGFATLRVTGKRPTMVLDVPDVAARVGRLNGARKIVLLLVDAMRFDVGERIATRLQQGTAGRAVCVERHLLWSALPTTTATQLALLGRGSAGLRDFTPSSEPEPTVERGRGVSTLRRERVGARDVMKLDLVEARLRTSGPPLTERLDCIADEAAPIIARFIESLPPRTMLYVFGDHGFRFPHLEAGRATPPAVQGGATPEEVLVPGYAWLVDGVH